MSSRKTLAIILILLAALTAFVSPTIMAMWSAAIRMKASTAVLLMNIPFAFLAAGSGFMGVAGKINFGSNKLWLAISHLIVLYVICIGHIILSQLTYTILGESDFGPLASHLGPSMFMIVLLYGVAALFCWAHHWADQPPRV